MKASILLLAAMLAGCAHPPQKTSTTFPATPTAPPVRSAESLLMRGEPHEAATKSWRVRVSTDELQIHSIEPSGGSISTSPANWRAGQGWFAFIENEQRVWAYDGDRQLLLVEMERDGDHSKMTASGPTQFSSAVPPQVLQRLTDEARNAIKTPE